MIMQVGESGYKAGNDPLINIHTVKKEQDLQVR